jgi:V/A-type H+/Na+-transporting ATPase subunit I
MSTVAMRKLEVVALKRDMNGVLECLGHSGRFQLSPPGEKRPASCVDAQGELAVAAELSAARYGEPLARLEELRRFLDFRYPDKVPEGARLPGAEEEVELEGMLEAARRVDEALRSNAERAARVREALEEAETFAGLGLPYRELDSLSYLTVRIGRIDPEDLQGLREALGDRALAVAAGRKGDIVAVASRKGRFALDTELARAGFAPRRFSRDFAGVPPELPAALSRSLAELEAEREFLEGELDDLRAELGGGWARLAASFAVASAVEEARVSLESSAQAYRLEGWAPAEAVGALAEAIEARTEGRVALRAFEPRELESVGSGCEEVPVLLKRRPFVSSFERMVLSFGVPRYGDVDPTPFVCAFFVIIFSIMFGDLGQGLLILVGSLAIRFGLVPSVRSWKPFAPIGVACGVGSIVMGILTGSCFTFESLLVPFTRAVSAALLGAPTDRFLSLMPEGGSGKVLYFFGFTIALGAVVNSTGLVINMIDRFRARRPAEALFAKTGLAGAALFWWALGMGLRAVLGGRPAWFDVLGLGLPLAALALEEPLGRIVEGRDKGGAKREGGEGAFAGIVKGFVAVLEAVSFYLSNTLSFLRVAAFALSHVVLSFIVFTMGDMVRQSAPFGLAGQVLIVIVGNAIIVFLEGLVVAIQVVRLQYYEFLSKFLVETGRPFEPLKFRFRKETI